MNNNVFNRSSRSSITWHVRQEKVWLNKESLSLSGVLGLGLNRKPGYI